MPALRYNIVVESDTPPQVMLGAALAGGTVVALSIPEQPKLVDVTWLCGRYTGLSRDRITEIVRSINKGTAGKILVDPDEADKLIQSAGQVSKRGRGRKN